MLEIRRKHSLPTRLFHWVNAVALTIMIWSGLLIYWANSVYRLRLFDVTIVEFFPDWFYSNALYSLEGRLAEGMAWHFASLWVFSINGAAYVLYTAFSGEWRHLVPNRRSPREAVATLLHDMGIRKEPPPAGKFNGAQRIAYTGVVLMGLGSLATGIAIYKPERLWWLCRALGGYETARAVHFILTIGYVLFFLIHVTQVIRAGWNNFRAMVVGVELVEGPAHVDASA